MCKSAELVGAEKGLDIYQFKSDGKIGTKGRYHIQNVNNYDYRLKGMDSTLLWSCHYISKQLPLGVKY